jgi:hypothetical protein
MSIVGEIKDKLRKYGLTWFGRYYSIYQGFVVENEDPSVLCRLKVKVPAVHGDNELANYAYPKGIPAQAGSGLYFVPAVDEAVWIEFVEGDPEFPVWSYGWWGSGEKVSGAKKDNSLIVFQSPNGQRIELNESENRVTIKQKDGSLVKISGDEVHLEQKDGFTVTMSSSDLQLNGSSLGPLPVTDNIVTKLNTIENTLNSFMTAYNAHTHPTTAPGAPTGPMTSPAPGPIAPITIAQDIQNDKVKQGS